MELSIDTSTRYASLALSREGEVTIELAWRSEQNHSVELVPALRQLMSQANVRMEQIEAIFVAKGPGGFSALRVGISVAKALAMAQSVPLIGVGTLDIEAQPYLGLGIPVCAVIEAGRSKIYAAIYGPQERGGGNASADYRVESHQGLVSAVPEGTLFCGEAARSIADAVREHLGSGSPVMDAPLPSRRPGELARLGYRRLQASDSDDLERLQPVYILGSQFEVAQRRAGDR
jgi:tRNA threonylcarbamoyladenosine biosynthesis protein TsaB